MEEHELLRRAEDLRSRCERSGSLCATHFLTPAERLRLEAIQRDFLKAHLNRWVCAFADAVERVEGISAFYPTFARFAALLCMRDPLLPGADER